MSKATSGTSAAPHVADAHAGYSRDRHPGESAERVLALDVGAKRVFVFPRTTSVMPGLVPGIHVLHAAQRTWMAGTSPAMTRKYSCRCRWPLRSPDDPSHFRARCPYPLTLMRATHATAIRAKARSASWR